MELSKNGITAPASKPFIDDTLITTKLHIPPMKSRMIMRRHLTDRLREGSSSRLVVICGLPGSGKTSLACQWIAEDHLPVAWYSLDKTDNDADLFFRYLLTSLGTIDDTIASQVAPLLQELRQFSGPEIIPLIIRLFVDLPRDIYLVLDDYHLIHTKEIHDALSYFLEYMPPRMHMVILSRHAIPLSLSRFRVRSQLTEIVASDLKFTEEETERFFTDIMPVTLTTDEVHELARYTEGWVGGLQLFGLSLKGKGLNDLGDILSRACQETTDYLIDEVIKVQPRKVKTFIQTTALLDRFNVDLCREVTGFTDTPDILEHLYRNNLFLIPLNTENTWHRYHHLLSEAVRKGVKNINPALYRDIQRKAALWFARHGYLEDAFRHAFASEDYEFVADIMEDNVILFQEQYEVRACRRWLGNLPGDIYTKRPLLRLYECGIKMGSLRLDDAAATLRDIEERKEILFGRYKGLKRRLCDDLLTHFKSLLLFCRDPAGADLSELSDAAQNISSENALLSGLVRMQIGITHFLRGDLSLASGALREASLTILPSESLWAQLTWCRHASSVERIRGRLHRAMAVLKDASALLEQRRYQETHLRSLLYLPMAWLAYYRNDVEEALGYAELGTEYAEGAQFVYDMVEGNILLACIHYALGNYGKVDYCMEYIQKLARESSDSKLMLLVEATTARFRVIFGDLEWAKDWVQRRKISVDEPFSLMFAIESVTHADILYHQGVYEEAVRCLDDVHDKCVEQGMFEPILDVDILLCASLYALKRYDRIGPVMENALKFSESEGFIRPFINHAAIITPILNDVVDGRFGHSRTMQALRILQACGFDERGGLRTEKVAQKPGREITQREIEILKLMAEGYQYKQIAEKACISFETVKTHTKHIFEKLGARTRIQAIRRAENLCLIEKS